MRKVILSDVINIISGGTPKTSVREYWENGSVGWLSINDFNNDNRKVYASEKTITQKGLNESNTKLLDIDDIIISARGTVGVLAQIGSPMAFNQSCFGIRGKKDIIDNTYLYYALKNYVTNIQKRGQGSVFNTINLDSFKLMEISIEENLSIQHQIAAVLSALDDKIELNNRINAELEQMARTIYDYWFGQFDFPDKKGKPYKSTGGKMVYNEMLGREIPEGWEVKKLGNVLNTHLGGTPSTKNRHYWNGSIPWINSGEVANFPLVSTEQTISNEAIDNSSTKFLPKGSVLLSITRHLRVNILGIDACINQSIVGIEENNDLKNCYIYFSILSDIDRLMSLRTGAQQPHINKEIVDESPFIIPQQNVLYQYYLTASGIFERIINNAKQNQQLSSLRDWLLPMLMNGQVKVLEKTEVKMSMAAEPDVDYGN